MKKNKILNKKNIILFFLIFITVISSIVILNVKETALKGNITIWIDSEHYDYVNYIAREFMQENEKCKVQVVKVEQEEVQNSLKDSMNKNKLPDLVCVNYDNKRRLLENEVIHNKIKNCNYVIEKNSNEYTERILQGSFNDKNYNSIPFASRPIILYLRQDMLNQYGYSNSDINTWDDMINIGVDIYNRSNREVKILNGVGNDKDYIISLIIMQTIEQFNYDNLEASESDIREELIRRYNNLVSNNVLNTDPNGKFLARISSVEGARELSALDADCEWTANYVPSTDFGGNKFYIKDSKDFIQFNNGNEKEPIVNKFISLMAKSKQSSTLASENKIFIDYLSVYKTSNIENRINNFSGKSPMVLMSNIYGKAPIISDYDEYTSIKRQVNF